MGINRQQALDCFASDDLIGIGMEADAVRRQWHPEGVVSYAVGCSIDASLERGAILDEIAATVAVDGTAISVGGSSTLHPQVSRYGALFDSIKQRFPQVSLSGLTASDIVTIARGSSLTVSDTLLRLRDAGLDAIAGDDAVVRDDLPSARSQESVCSQEEWTAVHLSAHALDMPTMAAMTIGGGETAEHRVQHLERLAQLQAETGGFRAFTLLTYQPYPGAPVLDEPTSVEYLKTLAISRMYLDSIEHFQSAGLAQGTKVLQMGLRFGADDAGCINASRQLSKLGAKISGRNAAVAEEEIRRLIRDAGFTPVQRDALHTRLFLA